MRGLTKRILCLLCVLILGIAAIGCKAADEEGDKVGDGDVKVEDAYNQELANYFPIVEGTVLKYYGTAEYGQTLTLNNVTENKENLVLDFNGEILDVSGGEGPSRDELLFETQYEINKDSVIESQMNADRRFSQSIIREQIVLKAPIEEGESWEQTVTIDGKEYKAKTTITEISKDEKGKNLVKTEMTINDIEFYPEDTYKEIRTFKEGKGLAEFKNTVLLKGPEGVDPAPFDFGYRLFEQE